MLFSPDFSFLTCFGVWADTIESLEECNSSLEGSWNAYTLDIFWLEITGHGIFRKHAFRKAFAVWNQLTEDQRAFFVEKMVILDRNHVIPYLLKFCLENAGGYSVLKNADLDDIRDQLIPDIPFRKHILAHGLAIFLDLEDENESKYETEEKPLVVALAQVPKTKPSAVVAPPVPSAASSASAHDEIVPATISLKDAQFLDKFIRPRSGFTIEQYKALYPVAKYPKFLSQFFRLVTQQCIEKKADGQRILFHLSKSGRKMMQEKLEDSNSFQS